MNEDQIDEKVKAGKLQGTRPCDGCGKFIVKPEKIMIGGDWLCEECSRTDDRKRGTDGRNTT